MPTTAVAGPQRLVSLDAFRGATIALMVLVNTPGDWNHIYAPLRHAEWHGWTPTDVVFPSFLWIAGMSLTLSFTRRVTSGASRGALLRQAARRAVILYVIGLFLSSLPHFDLPTLRLLGVLQRIAICSLAGAAIWLTTSTRGRIGWVVGLLAAYSALMLLVPVPGYGAGRLDVEGNFAHYVDRIVLGRHNYAHTRTWDPEGIVSTLPAIATFILGMLAGESMLAPRDLRHRLGRIAAVGVVLLVAGQALHPWMPINKQLWTPSFTLFMAGLDGLLFAACALIVDVLGWRRLVQPFAIIGMNALAIYVLSQVLETVLSEVLRVRGTLYRDLFLRVASPVNASLLFALAYTGLMFFAGWWLYHRRWFIKI